MDTYTATYSQVATREEMPSDLEIAQRASPLRIGELAAAVGLLDDELEPYGKYKAKVQLSVLERLRDRRDGKLVVVGGMSPTPLGEGKSTTTVGLSQAIGSQLRRRVFTCVRQPSQGPTFGVKGGAAGGGYAQVVPMEEFNLHLTGDIHAVSAAHNLLCAAVDARMFHESTQSDEALLRRLCPVDAATGRRRVAPSIRRRLRRRLGVDEHTDIDSLDAAQRRRLVRLDIEPASVTLRRVVDVNDRFLREIDTGLGDRERGHGRRSGFDISVASEVMAILALSTSVADLQRRLQAIVVGYERRAGGGDGDVEAPVAVTADDLGIGGALTVLQKDALMPNLMQTLERTPVFVHAGPFANIAHGNSSVVADLIALKLVGERGFVLTEAGFGADIGVEKFCDIKCRAAATRPHCAVLVATVRALKLHGGGADVSAGTPLPAEYRQPNLELVQRGFARHIENTRRFGVPVVVCLNRFASDSDEELRWVRGAAMAHGAADAVVAEHFARGGAGAVDLARAVVKACERPSEFTPLYRDGLSLREKIECVAERIYRAGSVEYSDEAKEAIDHFEKMGFGHLPVCMAKTQYSFSADAKQRGAPSGFALPVRSVRLSAGAGFVYPLCGDVQTMPGLPTRPAYYDIDIDAETGRIVGLS